MVCDYGVKYPKLNNKSQCVPRPKPDEAFLSQLNHLPCTSRRVVPITKESGIRRQIVDYQPRV